MKVIIPELIDEKEAKRLCVLALADQLKKWSELNPTASEKFMIGQITDALGWGPEFYVNLGFEPEMKGRS